MSKAEKFRLKLNIPAVICIFLMLTFITGLFSAHRISADENVKRAGKETVKIKQFNSKQLKLTNAVPADIRWASSNTYVCTVNANGLVQAVGGGSCTVTANYDGKDYTWVIKVTPIKLNASNITLLKRREGFQLKINNKNIQKAAVWYSSNHSAATVSGGYVTPHSAGSAVVSAVYGNVTLSCSVSVLDVTKATLRKVYSPKNNNNRSRVILAGGAIFDHWTSVYSAFGSTRVINNAIAASTLANWNNWSKKLITDYKPKAVVFCLGNADIGDGTAADPQILAQSMQKIIEKVHKKSKKTKIFYCSQPVFPYKPSAWTVTNEYNSLMKAYCKNKKYVTYLNLNETLMKNGSPNNTNLFNDEHTYFSASGYDILRKVVVKKVRKAAK